MIKFPAALTTVTPLSKSIALAMVVALPFVGLYIGIQYQKSISPLTECITVKQMPTKMPITPTTTASLVSPSTMIKNPKIISPATPNQFLPSIIYEPSGKFTEDEKQQLKEKIADPLTLYENERIINLTAIIFSKREGQQPYDTTFLAAFQNSGYLSAVVYKKAGNIEWWLPECMGECPFSPAFKAKYPEIVKKLTP